MNFNRYALLVAVIGLFTIAGCAVPLMKMDAEQTAFHAKAAAQPLKFSVHKSQDEETWGRAQAFVARYSRMKMQVVTDYVIQTYTPEGAEVKYGYYINRAPVGDSLLYQVDCLYSNELTDKKAIANAHYLAYYMTTAELMESIINK